MRSKHIALLILPLLLLLTLPTTAQFIDQGFGGGMAYGGTIGQTGEDNNKVGYLVRGFLRYGFVSHLAVEAGAASAKVHGTDYYSWILPAEARLLYSPVDMGAWNIYLAAGIGGLRYWQYDVVGEIEGLRDVASMAYVPLGIGFQRMVSNTIAIELRGDYNMGLSDFLSPGRDDKNDNFITFSLGFTWVGGDEKDSDGDGLTDSRELRLKTDPKNPDTDGDKLLDGQEVDQYGTNPLLKDTDTGSVDDGIEVQRGTDPLNAADDVLFDAVIGSAITLEGITFDLNSSEIKEESEPTLLKAYYTLYLAPSMEVEIQGHTDNTGSRETNMQLSLERANAVRSWLVAQGIDGKRITTKGFGPDQPKASNDTEEGRKQNRRIEFVRSK